MQKHEFKVKHIGWSQASGYDDLESELNKMGEQGWDLISITENENFNSASMGQVFHTVWKRPK